ncbi:holin [Salmonella phage 41]|nr:holin [Salmonella phage 41]
MIIPLPVAKSLGDSHPSLTYRTNSSPLYAGVDTVLTKINLTTTLPELNDEVGTVDPYTATHQYPTLYCCKGRDIKLDELKQYNSFPV